jgi:hypothetical protein
MDFWADDQLDHPPRLMLMPRRVLTRATLTPGHVESE